MKKTNKTGVDTYQQTSATIEGLLADAISRIKAEADQKVKDLSKQIAQITAKAEEKAKAITKQIDQIKADIIEAQKAAAIPQRKPSVAGSVSETIRKIVKSPAEIPSEQPLKASAIYAKDIMQKAVWSGDNDTVQQALEKMQKMQVRHILVGTDGVLEGIVSKSDLKGAVSPYLRPMFAKWRRPQDDATLKLRVKLIMSKPVHTISPQMPLAIIMSNMSRLNICALPVVDQQGKVLGLVTEADVFEAVLKPASNLNHIAPDKSHQIRSTSPKPPERTKANQPTLVNA